MKRLYTFQIARTVNALFMTVAVFVCFIGNACGKARATNDDLLRLRKQCKAGFGESCNSLGIIYAHGRGVKKNHVVAAEFYRLACEYGSTYGCVNLGLALEMPLGGVKGDLNEAAELYDKACDAGNADGCFKLGSFYDEMGPSTHRNCVKSASAYERACTLGFSGGCVQLAKVYREKGAFVGGSSVEASRLLEKACEEREPMACLSLAEMYRGQEIPDGDARKAEKLVKDATQIFDGKCLNGDAGSCFVLGMYYEKLNATKENRDRAKTYYSYSCKHGNEIACEWAR